MANSLGYSLTILLCIISASFHAFGNLNPSNSPDACQNVTAKLTTDKLKGCLDCVEAVDGNNQSCYFVQYLVPKDSIACEDHHTKIPQGSSSTKYECEEQYDPKFSTTAQPPTTVTPTNETTTVKPSTTAAPTNATSTPPTPTPTPAVTNVTTPAPSPSNVTTSVPSGSTTTGGSTVKPTPAPSGGGGGFSFATFLGGIVFTLAVSALAYVAFRFYKARTSRNYSNLINESES